MVISGCTQQPTETPEPTDPPAVEETEAATSNTEDMEAEEADESVDESVEAPDTSEVSEEADEAEAAEDAAQSATEEAAADVESDTAAETEEPAASETEVAEPEVQFASEDGAYYVAVSYMLDEDALPETELELPDGSRWAVAVVTLGNESGDAVEVQAESIAILDADGNRYPAEVDDDLIEPQLIGTELNEGESVLGFARFAVPVETTLTLFEWCVDSECELVLQSQIP